jgi:hypothetical protein
MNEMGITRESMRELVQQGVQSVLHHYVDSLLQQNNVQQMILNRVTDICWSRDPSLRPRNPSANLGVEASITQWLYHVIKDAVSTEVMSRLSVHMQPLLPGSPLLRTRSVVLDPPSSDGPASPAAPP